jgi:hypothetical protein
MLTFFIVYILVGLFLWLSANSKSDDVVKDKQFIALCLFWPITFILILFYILYQQPK